MYKKPSNSSERMENVCYLFFVKLFSPISKDSDHVLRINETANWSSFFIRLHY